MISNDEFQKILDLDLDPIKVKLMHAESGEGWSLSRVNGIEREYKRFLFLMKKFPAEHTAPLVDVDTFWHYHILDTMKYAADCEHVFGYFLHHFPYIGMRGEEDAATLARMGERMGVVYEQTFGESYLQVATGLRKEAAYCAHANGRATLADAGNAAYCAATADAGGVGAEAAYCAATQAAAYCAATHEAGATARPGAAYCAATKAAAYCAATSEAGAAARTDAAYCAATVEPAYCASHQPRGQLASKGAAYCAAQAAASYCAAKPEPAYCATSAQPGLKADAAYCASTASAAYCASRPETASDTFRVAAAYCASTLASGQLRMSEQRVARLYSERPVLAAA